MQAVQAPSKQHANRIASSALISTPFYWLTHIFGCWHRQKMGAPFTLNNETHCTCMGCGACRQFDLERWKPTGSFYYPPVSVLYDTPYHPVTRVPADKDSFRPSTEDTLPGVFCDADFRHRIAEFESTLM